MTNQSFSKFRRVLLGSAAVLTLAAAPALVAPALAAPQGVEPVAVSAGVATAMPALMPMPASVVLPAGYVTSERWHYGSVGPEALSSAPPCRGPVYTPY